MWYLFLDESGDLGFDFDKKTTRMFTICILATASLESYYAIRKAVEKTLRRKVNRGARARIRRDELKGTTSSMETKRYFYRLIADRPFSLFAMTLNKKRVHRELAEVPDRLYNFISRVVLSKIPFEKANDQVRLVVDRSKGKAGMKEFNEYIISQLKGRLNPKVPLHIEHRTGQEEPVLQACDLFCWGIFRSRETKDPEWLNHFRAKVRCDEVYLG